MKAGWAYEIMDEYDKALDAYKEIQKEFPRSAEAREMEKYIARAEGLRNK